MKLLWIGGNHPRHLYIINEIAKEFEIAGAIIQKRENLLPEPPANISEIDRVNFIKHFASREKSEKKYFGIQKMPNCDVLEVDDSNLNSQQSVNFTNSIKPNLIFIFGSDLIKEPLYSSLPKDAINLHLGLSPRYRGAATLFWPFYFMEPTYAGSTFHHIISEPDAGNIIHQCTPLMELNDGIHDIACKTVIKSTHDAKQLLKIYKKNGTWIYHKPKGTGRNFLENDFRPEHLRVIYNIFNNDMVKQYLEGNLNCKKPNLVHQF